jgi:hypothetical protein
MRTLTVYYTCDPSVFLFCFSGLQNSNLWQIHQIQNMNHKPQTLPCLPAMFVLAGSCLVSAIPGLSTAATFAVGPFAAATFAADEPAPGTEAPAATPATDAPAATADASGLPAADEILTKLRTTLEELQSLKCEMRQTSLIAGMKLSAVGQYAEASGNRVSLKYVIYPISPEKAEDGKQLALDAAPPEMDESKNRGVLIQVCDGTVLSTSWKNGDTQRVTRRNIRDILTAAGATGSYDPKNAAMDLGVGGLRGMIARLQNSMEFAPVKSIQVGDRKVLEVTGRWNEKIRKEVFKVPENSLVDPRPQVPEYARVYVDAETMLPRRIQFLKRSMDPTEKMVRPLITLDLRNVVVNEAIEDSVFVFQAPENTPEEDQTEQVIQMIQQSLQPAKTTDPASPQAEGPPAAAAPQ